MSMNFPAYTRRLITRVEFLRNAQTSLMTGSGQLLAYGVTQHGPATGRALTFIKAEAHTLVDHFQARGFGELADDTRQGWAIVIPPDATETAQRFPLIDYPACDDEGCASNPARFAACCPSCRRHFCDHAHVFATFDADPWREWITGIDAELGGPLPPGYEPTAQERHLITTLAATMGYTVEWSETPRSDGTGARAWWNLNLTGWPDELA